MLPQWPLKCLRKNSTEQLEEPGPLCTWALQCVTTGTNCLLAKYTLAPCHSWSWQPQESYCIYTTTSMEHYNLNITILFQKYHLKIHTSIDQIKITHFMWCFDSLEWSSLPWPHSLAPPDNRSMSTSTTTLIVYCICDKGGTTWLLGATNSSVACKLTRSNIYSLFTQILMHLSDFTSFMSCNA